MKKQPILIDNISLLEEKLFVFRRKLRDMLQKEAQSLRCPISQIDTLFYIVEKGNPSMKEIAHYLNVTPPSATAIIETMQKKKLITRMVNDKDRRTVRVTLTPKAWKLFKSFHERKFTILKKMISKLQENEQRQLIKILNILIKE